MSAYPVHRHLKDPFHIRALNLELTMKRHYLATHPFHDLGIAALHEAIYKLTYAYFGAIG